MMHKKNWDIFCKVVDNFGDIGVCWRLAQQLNNTHHITVRLWVDDLHVAQRLIPTLNLALSTQMIAGIEIVHWQEHADFTQASAVVIEAFSCGLPAPYQPVMQVHASKWINLEYLSAESWVQYFHAKPSPQPNGLTRYFYFPGFTNETGGLLGFGQRATTHAEFSHSAPPALKLSLFCYPHAPIRQLLDVIVNADTPVHCYIPNTSILNHVAHYFGRTHLEVGQTVESGLLTVEVLPFLSQADYDELLAHCDINFVRGEDSWVRAIWANKPFIWQPYLQEDNAHIEKLNAFLKQFYTGATTETFSAIQAMHHQWASEHITTEVWRAYLAQLEAVKLQTQSTYQALLQQPDLASKLVIFCNNL
jgi:uncharacterized repeat protein (TIGR03837 family)